MIKRVDTGFVPQPVSVPVFVESNLPTIPKTKDLRPNQALIIVNSYSNWGFSYWGMVVQNDAVKMPKMTVDLSQVEIQDLDRKLEFDFMSGLEKRANKLCQGYMSGIGTTHLSFVENGKLLWRRTTDNNSCLALNREIGGKYPDSVIEHLIDDKTWRQQGSYKIDYDPLLALVEQNP